MTFESLFNWGISREWAEALSKEHVIKNLQAENLYFLRVTRHLSQIHALVLCENFEAAKIYIDKLLLEMDDIQNVDLEEKLISTKVLNHIVYVTIQKSFEKMGNHDKAKEIEKKVTPLVMTTNIEKSTLYGIRSFCLYQYYEAIEIAYNFAENARKLNSDCSFWNLVFALCLRHRRRNSSTSKPSFLEKKYFYIAYTQNADPHFGVRLAQCYKESGDQEKALNIFKELKQLDIEAPDIWLRLALGFIYYKELELAKECLDEAEKIDDSLAMFHHYKGLFFMKGYENYDEAIIHLKKSSDQGNYKAFMDYLFCLYRKNPYDRSVLELLEGSTEKYVHQQFEIKLSIALYYGINLKDYENALIKLRDTVKEKPLDRDLSNFYYTFVDKYHHISIFKYIETQLLPKSRSILNSNNHEAWEAHEFLKNFAMTNKPSRNNDRNNSRTD